MAPMRPSLSPTATWVVGLTGPSALCRHGFVWRPAQLGSRSSRFPPTSQGEPTFPNETHSSTVLVAGDPPAVTAKPPLSASQRARTGTRRLSLPRRGDLGRSLAAPVAELAFAAPPNTASN